MVAGCLDPLRGASSASGRGPPRALRSADDPGRAADLATCVAREGGGWGDATRPFFIKPSAPQAQQTSHAPGTPQRLSVVVRRRPSAPAPAATPRGATRVRGENMGRGGIGGAAAMETADSTRAFVKDVKRIIIKVCVHTSSYLPLFLPFF